MFMHETHTKQSSGSPGSPPKKMDAEPRVHPERAISCDGMHDFRVRYVRNRQGPSGLMPARLQKQNRSKHTCLFKNRKQKSEQRPCASPTHTKAMVCGVGVLCFSRGASPSRRHRVAPSPSGRPHEKSLTTKYTLLTIFIYS